VAAASEGLAGAAGWVCGLLSSPHFCSKAARAAAWAGVSSARRGMTLVPKATHKPNKSFFFMELTSPG
jgi:hypothetical protein